MKLPLTLVPNAPIIAGMKTDKSQILGIPGFPELSNEDAAFIVRACNSHAALVAALERACDHLIMSGTKCTDAPEALAQARAALQSAKPTA